MKLAYMAKYLWRIVENAHILVESRKIHQPGREFITIKCKKIVLFLPKEMSLVLLPCLYASNNF